MNPNSNTDIAHGTITNMRFFEKDGKQILMQQRTFPADVPGGQPRTVWEEVGTEASAVEIPWTERFANDEHKPHSLEPRNTDNIVRHINKIKPVDFSEVAVNKAISMRLYAMLVRVCSGDVDQVAANGVYFNKNAMGMDLVRLMMEAYGPPWSNLVDKLHLGSRDQK